MNDMMTVVENMVAQFGSNNIFLIKVNYQSFSEDDDCEFEYYNNITGESFEDSWTTRCVCPAYNRYLTTNIKTALQEGLIDIPKFMNFVKKRFQITSKNLELNIECVASCGLRIEVTQGRKWKGVGYLIGLEKNSYQFYKPNFVAPRGYGRQTTEIAKIYDPLTGKIERATAKYIKFVDEKRLIAEYIEEYNAAINTLTIHDLIFDKKGIFFKQMCLSFNLFVKQNFDNGHLYTNGYDETVIEQQRKAQEYREKQMKNILIWVQENTDKTGIDALELAEKIFNKRCV